MAILVIICYTVNHLLIQSIQCYLMRQLCKEELGIPSSKDFLITKRGVVNVITGEGLLLNDDCHLLTLDEV